MENYGVKKNHLSGVRGKGKGKNKRLLFWKKLGNREYRLLKWQGVEIFV